jgi:hypothetical protein
MFWGKFISTDVLGFGVQIRPVSVFNLTRIRKNTISKPINAELTQYNNETINYTDLAFAGDCVCVECL